MTLTTHAIVGAAAARLFPENYITAFVAGFISHFLIDAIPHWDYKLRSIKKDPENPLNNDMVFGFAFILDVVDISLDFFLALTLPFLIFGVDNLSQSIILFAGIAGGLLPDLLQFVYFKWRHEPLISLQKFHGWIHTDNKLTNWKSGIALQVVLNVLVIFISFKIYS
jgi:hypothetical protein